MAPALATPLRQRPLDLGADVVVASASKHLTGHSDLVLGYAATRSSEWLDAMRGWRTVAGATPGPFEVWLAHRSLPTLAVAGYVQRYLLRGFAGGLK